MRWISSRELLCWIVSPALLQFTLKSSAAVSSTPFHNPSLYRSIVGALQYITITRPDLAFAVNSVCQHMQSPTDDHFTAVKRILPYLKGTVTLGIQFTRGPFTLTAYSDADWAGDTCDRRSVSGYCLFMGNNPIAWCAKKQATVARSSTESEYRCLAHTAAELSWLRMLFKDLQIPLFHVPTIWCENISAISLASNPVFHARTKQIEVDYHFIREKVLHKDLQVRNISTVDQVSFSYLSAVC